MRGVERLDAGSVASADRTWAGNDESARNHNGVVRLSESPLTLALSWRYGKGKPATIVGCFRLDLPQLLANGLVRAERRGEVRLRFFHDHDGKIYLQTRLDAPCFVLGKV
jgi:hypothetical protein